METKPGLFGVIGHPIEHSLSPVMHAAAFKELGLDYSYSAFNVEEGDLEAFVGRWGDMNFLGLNVTIPHKVRIIRYLDELDENARLINAVNTIKFGYRLVGYNTDGLGCVRSLEEEGERIRGRRILILGSGGAARAIAFRCAQEGAEIAISNRTREAAMKLAREIKEGLGRRILVVNYNTNSIKDIIPTTDILINTTSVGMYPKIHRCPIPSEVLDPKLTVMDIVYNPIETQLLKNARMIGCKTIDGVGMFVHQGAESLKIWLDVKPPIEVMRNAVLEKLKSGDLIGDSVQRERASDRDTG